MQVSSCTHGVGLLSDPVLGHPTLASMLQNIGWQPAIGDTPDFRGDPSENQAEELCP